MTIDAPVAAKSLPFADVALLSVIIVPDTAVFPAIIYTPPAVPVAELPDILLFVNVGDELSIYIPPALFDAEFDDNVELDNDEMLFDS